MSVIDILQFTVACNSLAASTRFAVAQLKCLADVINEHREQWLCEGEGQWPDKFVLLNRYVRTDYEPPFIIND